MDNSATKSNAAAASARAISTIDTRGAIWRADQQGQDMLLSDLAPDFFALERDPRAVRIKDGAGRSIWRVALGEQNVFCKVYERPGGMDRIKRYIRGPIAQREFNTAFLAKRRGVAVARAIGWGRQTSAPYRTVVVSSEVEPATVLTNCPLTPSTTPAIIDAVAHLVSSIHNWGMVHNDGHPGNILIQHAPDAPCKAWYVDLCEVRFHRRSVRMQSAAIALGHLNHHYARVTSTQQRLRFLVRYLRDRHGRLLHSSTIRTFVDRIRSASESHAVQLAWHRDRRLKNNNKYFARLDLGDGWHARVALKLARRRVAPAPHVVDRSKNEWRTILSTWLTANAPSLDTAVANATVSEPASTAERTHDGLRYLVTQHTGFTRRLLHTLLGSAARHMFEHSHHLRHRDLPTPLILGHLEHRRHGLTDMSILIFPDDSGDREYLST